MKTLMLMLMAVVVIAVIGSAVYRMGVQVHRKLTISLDAAAR